MSNKEIPLKEEKSNSWKQPWLWFTLSPLILSVVLGTTMLIISIQVQDGLVTDDYSKEGFTINEKIEREVEGKNLELTAAIKLDDMTGDLTLDLGGKLNPLPEQLLLEIIHPVRAELDIPATVHHQINGRYIGQLPVKLNQRRYIRVTDPSNPNWLLKGEISFPTKEPAMVIAQ
jgi:hypothetical protein